MIRLRGTRKGTLINTVAPAGTLLGVLWPEVPEKMKDTVMNGLGLVTSIIGISTVLKLRIFFPLSGIAFSAIIGEWLNIEKWEHLARHLRKVRGHRRTACQRVCIGHFVVLYRADGYYRRIQEASQGLQNSQPRRFDGFTNCIRHLWGVGFSALPVFVYQGAITLGAGFFDRVFTEQMITEMTATGGLLLFAIGLGLLEIKKIRVANLLPAIFLTPAICYLIQLVWSSAGF